MFELLLLAPESAVEWVSDALMDELDALSFPEQFEYRPANGRTMKEVFDTTFVANEAETLVDEQTCNRAIRHD